MKAKSPLFETITKTLKPSPFQEPITFRRRYGRDIIIKKHPFPTDAKTAAQIDIRTAYSRLVSIWNTPGAVDQAVYIPDAEKYNITSYNAFLKRNLPVLFQKPAIYFPADAGAGTTLHDYSIHENNGTIHGATWETLPTSNHVLKFDGVDDFVRIPLDDFPALMTDITIEFWASPSGVFENGSIFLTVPPDPFNRINIHFPWSDGRVYWDFGDITAGGRLTIPWDSAWNNVWAHWVFSSESGIGQKIYRNAVLLASDNTWSYFSRGTKPLDIAKYHNVFWAGLIDEVRIYNRALSAEEIATNYKHSRMLFL